MEPLEREIRLGGLRFHYVEWGTAAAPPLVLLHGFTGHARTWDDFAASVADCFRVLALDQRGHGDSNRAPHGDYRIAAMAQDLAAFADALCPGPFSLVGLSMRTVAGSFLHCRRRSLYNPPRFSLGFFHACLMYL